MRKNDPVSAGSLQAGELCRMPRQVPYMTASSLQAERTGSDASASPIPDGQVFASRGNWPEAMSRKIQGKMLEKAWRQGDAVEFSE